MTTTLRTKPRSALLLLLVVAGGAAFRQLVARSNTQVRRINQSR